jgi:hypothetical protein
MATFSYAYDFKLIEEDIFGKAYETFLAVPRDEGIYYIYQLLHSAEHR